MKIKIPLLKQLSVVALFFMVSFTSCIPPVNDKPADPRTFNTSDMNLLELGYTLPYIKDFMYSLEKTQLIYLMEETGPYTVFAPNQQSFVKFREKYGISHINQFPEMELADILLYHFIPQKRSLGDINEGYHPTLLSEKTTGNPIDLYIDKKSVFVLNGINYIDEPDMETINGYINSVNYVMDIPSVLDHLSFNSDFSLFTEMLLRQDLDPNVKAVLENELPITIFAPTDQAIESFLAGHPVWATIYDIPSSDLNDMIFNHLVDHGNVVLSSISPGGSLTTMGGKQIEIQVDYPRWRIKNNDRNLAKILIKDIQAVDGIIHQIDQVILP